MNHRKKRSSFHSMLGGFFPATAVFLVAPHHEKRTSPVLTEASNWIDTLELKVKKHAIDLLGNGMVSQSGDGGHCFKLGLYFLYKNMHASYYPNFDYFFHLMVVIWIYIYIHIPIPKILDCQDRSQLDRPTLRHTSSTTPPHPHLPSSSSRAPC